MTIVLRGSYTSPFVRHCRIALAQTDMDWRLAEADYDYTHRHSPTKKMPLLETPDGVLSDSTSILAYVRRQEGQPFIDDPWDWELYLTANTVLDTGVNLFLLEKEDVLPADVPYLQRQAERIDSALDYLDSLAPEFPQEPGDAMIRVACTLAWGRFRRRFSTEGRSRLEALLATADEWGPFQETAPTG